MAKSRSPWRALRPVLLAGAATLTWLTFSSTAASADTLSDTSSLLGGVTSSVSSVSEKLLTPAPGTPSTPASGQPAGLLQPVAGPVAGLADDIVASVPVLHHVVPAGTVSAVTTPVTRIVDRTASAVVEAVVPGVTKTVPVPEPVLEPATDLETGPTPLPVPVPALPGTDQDKSEDPAAPGIDGSSTAADQAFAGAAQTGEETGRPSATDRSSPDPSAAEANFPSPSGMTRVSAGALQFGSPGSFPASLASESPGEADTSPHRGPVPAAPVGAGAGSGAPASSGSSGSAAWLSSFDVHLPLADVYRAGEHPAHAPAPVSFDPGSSPD